MLLKTATLLVVLIRAKTVTMLGLLVYVNKTVPMLVLWCMLIKTVTMLELWVYIK